MAEKDQEGRKGERDEVEEEEGRREGRSSALAGGWLNCLRGS
jgi:hypothetical protein